MMDAMRSLVLAKAFSMSGDHASFLDFLAPRFLGSNKLWSWCNTDASDVYKVVIIRCLDILYNWLSD